MDIEANISREISQRIVPPGTALETIRKDDLNLANNSIRRSTMAMPTKASVFPFYFPSERPVESVISPRTRAVPRQVRHRSHLQRSLVRRLEVPFHRLRRRLALVERYDNRRNFNINQAQRVGDR